MTIAWKHRKAGGIEQSLPRNACRLVTLRHDIARGIGGVGGRRQFFTVEETVAAGIPPRVAMQQIIAATGENERIAAIDANDHDAAERIGYCARLRGWRERSWV